MSKQFGPRQRRTRFIKEYLLDHNATRAAIAAGYSDRTANEQGSRLLAVASIRERIEDEEKRINAALDVTVERVRKELARLAFYDPRKFFKDDGSLKAVSDLDDDTAMALAGMDVNELFDGDGEERQLAGYCKKVKLVDKGMNLERLGRYLKMFTDKHELTGEDGGPVQQSITVQFVKPDDTNQG